MFCTGDLETKFSNIQKGIGYMQFISIEYIVLVSISIPIPYKETIEDIREVSIYKLIHENTDGNPKNKAGVLPVYIRYTTLQLTMTSFHNKKRNK